MAAWHRACHVSALSEARPARIVCGEVVLALVRHGEGVAALSDRCPHAGGTLSDGWIEDGDLVCPLHRWGFRLDDGHCSTMRGEWVRTFRCELRGDEIWIEV